MFTLFFSSYFIFYFLAADGERLADVTDPANRGAVQEMITMSAERFKKSTLCFIVECLFVFSLFLLWADFLFPLSCSRWDC